jgi:hypothetical protein
MVAAGLPRNRRRGRHIYLILLIKNIDYNARRNALTAPGVSGVQGMS